MLTAGYFLAAIRRVCQGPAAGSSAPLPDIEDRRVDRVGTARLATLALGLLPMLLLPLTSDSRLALVGWAG